MKKLITLASLSILSVALAGCAQTAPVVDVEETVVEAPAEPVEPVTEVTVVGDDFSFSPSALTFTQGEKVKITFENQGNYPHNLTFEGLDVQTETIQGGESTTVEFTAPDAGKFTYYCGVGNHRSQGMEGTLFTE